MYKVEVLESKKVVHVVTGGLIGKEEGTEVINKIKNTFESINPTKYYLVIDAGDFKATFQDNLELLSQALNLYDKTPFIKKFFILPKSTVASMQVRGVDHTSLPNYLVRVESFEEALAQIK